MGGIDVLVNNVGALGTQSTAADIAWAPDPFVKAFEINCLSVVTACAAALPHLLESKGRVVNMSSIMSIAGNAQRPSYCAAKAAVDSVRRAL